jgi:hypothetical protein
LCDQLGQVSTAHHGTIPTHAVVHLNTEPVHEFSLMQAWQRSIFSVSLLSFMSVHRSRHFAVL